MVFCGIHGKYPLKKCPFCERQPSSIASDCSGAEAGAIGREAISAGPSVPGDSLRKIRELADEGIAAWNKKNLYSAWQALRDIRELCSNENRSGKET